MEKKIIRRAAQKSRYVVEGCYMEGNEGSPITGDYVMASSKDEAIKIVARVRASTDDWTSNIAETFEEHIARERERLDRMAAMTPEEVEQGWAETRANFNDTDDED